MVHFHQSFTKIPPSLFLRCYSFHRVKVPNDHPIFLNQLTLIEESSFFELTVVLFINGLFERCSRLKKSVHKKLFLQSKDSERLCEMTLCNLKNDLHHYFH